MSSSSFVLTSTTAPGKVFESRAELAAHYKSDWHKYNLKRREAGLVLLVQEDFTARLEAALALRKERDGKNERTGTGHLKEGKKSKKNKKKKEEVVKAGRGGGATVVSQAAAYDKIKNGEQADEPMEENQEETVEEEEEEEEEEPPVIEPRQCLFDKHMSPSLQANVARMHRKYGFFIPDVEYLDDLEGLLGYCHEKIKLGHYCLYCQRTFSTWTGCQKHMIMKRHTKLRYERGVDLAEFDPFYDFSAADKEYVANFLSTNAQYLEEDGQAVHEEDGEDDEEDGWEDVTDDEAEDEEMDDAAEDDDGLYAGYEEEISRFGFKVSHIGELVFPDGRIVGHRGLQRYYKQRAQPSAYSDSTAVVAAKRAAGERLYRGRVYDTAAEQQGEGTVTTTLQLARAGVSGGAGKGILVGSGSGSFTALSLYRYRAVVKKARRETATGQRHQQKARFRGNTNKMDKKHNRIMNGVSVAHAAR